MHGQNGKADSGHGEDGGGEREGSVLLDAAAKSEALLPGKAAGGEEDGVDGDDVVVLGVESHHADEEEDVGEAEVAVGAAPEEVDEAGDPDEGGCGVEVEDLGEEEDGWGEFFVFVFYAAVVEELPRGPVVVELPENVGEDEQEHDGDAVYGPLAAEKRSLRADDEGGEEGEEEEGHRRLVEEAQTGGEAEEEPEFLGAAVGHEDDSKERGHPED